jgi:hypothetical protein
MKNHWIMNKEDRLNIERALKDFRLVIKDTPQLKIGNHVFFEGEILQVSATDAEQGSGPNPNVYRVTFLGKPHIHSFKAGPDMPKWVVFQAKDDESWR